MIDLSSEQILTFSDARKLLPKRRGGKRPDISTLYRWCQVGLRGVRLEFIKIGGQTCTSIEALQRFFDALSTPTNGKGHPTTRSRSKHNDHVEKELVDEGI
jgi:hypothetical protein